MNKFLMMVISFAIFNISGAYGKSVTVSLDESVTPEILESITLQIAWGKVDPESEISWQDFPDDQFGKPLPAPEGANYCKLQLLFLENPPIVENVNLSDNPEYIILYDTSTKKIRMTKIINGGSAVSESKNPESTMQKTRDIWEISAAYTVFPSRNLHGLYGFPCGYLNLRFRIGKYIGINGNAAHLLWNTDPKGRSESFYNFWMFGFHADFFVNYHLPEDLLSVSLGCARFQKDENSKFPATLLPFLGFTIRYKMSDRFDIFSDMRYYWRDLDDEGNKTPPYYGSMGTLNFGIIYDMTIN